MNRAVGFIVAALVAGSGCGDDSGPPPMTNDELMARLRALHGVTVQEGDSAPENFSYYILHFTQPIDHHDPSKGTFQQQVSLLHHNELAPFPLIVYTSGYADEDGGTPVELTTLLDANQISIEHRFYGTSQPDPVDWSMLTVEQAAMDEHDIIQALRTIYAGSFLSVGESKGGITALAHRRFYPDDVRGTVAYVAPMSFNVPDPRYPDQLDQVGMPTLSDCHAAVRDLASMMLSRRAQMLDLARSDA
ncbi:MAG TPA: S28 family serine protease, partial [Kofleriaceae bacterium]